MHCAGIRGMKREAVFTIPADTEGCRKLYARIRVRSEARSKAAFDAAVLAKVQTYAFTAGGHTPQQWIKAACEVTFMCRRCAGTGRFITYVENGQPKGPGGVCYRCQGRGVQSDADVRRNYGADIHAFERACAAMFAGG